MDKMMTLFESEIKESDEKDLTVVHFISTERKDRGRDILYADGMKIEGKPVVLFQHGYSDLGLEPIAKPIWIKKGEYKNRKGIQAKTQFYPDEVGRRLWRKNVEGYMPNWSVGWRPIKYDVKPEKDGTEVRHVYEWELLEYSLVAVPMQPDAQTFKDEYKGLLFKIVSEKEERLGELVRWKIDDQWEEKPYPNEHACRLEDPDKYVRIRRENDKFGDGIHAIWGIQEDKPVELQAIRFDKNKYTVSEAKKWLKDHDYKCKLFEPASEKCKICGKEMIWDNHDEPCSGFWICETNHDEKESIETKLQFISENIVKCVNVLSKYEDVLSRLSVNPDTEQSLEEKDHLNPPNEIIVITSQDKKQQKEHMLKEALKPAMEQFSEMMKTIPTIIKEEFERFKGKVR